MRGAFWRNFQVKYREINDLHKQMLRASEAVAAMPDGPDRALAVDHLYQGQSNDCYWHGLFGGIYISHMRLATYEHLIAAEDLAETATDSWSPRSSRPRHGRRRRGPPGRCGQVVTVDLDGGGGIGGWDIRAVRHALTAVMRRRPEAYHEVLREFEAAGGAGRGGRRGAAAGERRARRRSTASCGSRSRGLSARLVYDRYERRSGCPRARARGHARGLGPGSRVDLGDAVDGAFELVELAPGRLVTRRDATIAGAAVRVTRTLTLGGDRRAPHSRSTVELEHRAGRRWTRGSAWNGRRRCSVAAGTRRHGGTWPGERTRARCRRHRDGRHVDRAGQRPHRRVRDDHDRCAGRRLVGADRDDLELGEWLRARLPGQRPALSWPVRLAAGERWSRTVRHAVRRLGRAESEPLVSRPS